MGGENSGKLTVGTTSANLLPARVNGERVDLFIRNSGATVITIKRGEAAAVALEGIVLSAGAAWVESTDLAVPCFQKQIQVISSAAGGVVSFSERLR